MDGRWPPTDPGPGRGPGSVTCSSSRFKNGSFQASRLGEKPPWSRQREHAASRFSSGPHLSPDSGIAARPGGRGEEATLSKSSRASQIRVYVRGHKETCPRRHAGQDRSNSRMSEKWLETEITGREDGDKRHDGASKPVSHVPVSRYSRRSWNSANAKIVTAKIHEPQSQNQGREAHVVES